MKRNKLLWSILFLLLLTSCAQTSAQEEQTIEPNVSKPESSATAAAPEASAPAQTQPAPAPDANTVKPEERLDGEQLDGVKDSDTKDDFIRVAGVMGTVFYVPTGFDRLDEEADIGYQYAYYRPDLDMRIEVHEIAPAYIPYGAIDVSYDSLADSPDVTYLTRGDNWFVASGYLKGGEQIFYYKYASENKTDLKYFEITYPTANRETCDGIVEQFEKNCEFYQEE